MYLSRHLSFVVNFYHVAVDQDAVAAVQGRGHGLAAGAFGQLAAGVFLFSQLLHGFFPQHLL